MGRYSVKRFKTKRRTRDLDQIFDDLSSPNSITNLKQQPENEEQPGLGQYYCVQCAKYFLDNTALKGHLKGKVHKRRVKDLKVNPYTPLESEAATGTNLEKFMNKVAMYKANEEQRRVMENEMLKNQTVEYDLRDEQKWREMYPEKAQEKDEKNLKEIELAQKRELKKAQKHAEQLAELEQLDQEYQQEAIENGEDPTILTPVPVLTEAQVTDEIVMD